MAKSRMVATINRRFIRFAFTSSNRLARNRRKNDCKGWERLLLPYFDRELGNFPIDEHLTILRANPLSFKTQPVNNLDGIQ